MNIFLTGAASGIGAALRDKLLKDGHTVFAVDLRPLKQEQNLFGAVADVRDAEVLRSCFAQLESLGTKFDAIICAAGIHDMISLVENDFGRFEKLIDVNLLGCARTINTFYPLLKPKGRVIIVSSEVAYGAPLPFNGGYGISKTALDCYAQALRYELSLLGQTVVVIRPGAVATPLCEGSLSSAERLSRETKLFAKQSKAFTRLTKRFMGTPVSPDEAAKIICKAIYAKRPKLSYSFNVNFGLKALNLLPKRLSLCIIKWLIG